MSLTSPATPPALPARVTLVRAGAPEAGSDDGPPRVLLLTEGTYPHAWGGVSTWCDSLVNVLSDTDFHILAVVAFPDPEPVFTLPANVRSVTTVPLWQVQDLKETWPRLTRRALRDARRATTAEAVQDEFLPALRALLHGVLIDNGDAGALAPHIHQIYRFLRGHDLQLAMHDRAVWDTCADVMQDAYRRNAERFALPDLALWELTTAMQWVVRWLFPLVPEIPEVDVVHAAMAGICTMVAAAATREHGAGYLLTEHGVYLRERYIAEAARTDSHFLKLLGLRFARRMTELSYHLADQISPCCDYNSRWERYVGAQPGQLATIYYGVDAATFSAEVPLADPPRRVVWVGRINPLKDVETLLRAAAETVKELPDVKFLLYGGAPAEDAAYHRRCLDLHHELGLEDVVTFCGYTSNPAAAFSSGDLVVLSSISEGFPYSTLEAMQCGRPVVATSVGGLPEQIGDAGAVVEPRNPVAMAQAILAILTDPAECQAMGRRARARATQLFGYGKFRSIHEASYRSLSTRYPDWSAWTPDATGHPPAPAADAAVEPLPEPAGDADAELSRLELALEVERRCLIAVDELEVAAVIESLGVTDPVARSDYGCADVFSLATVVFRALSAPHEEAPADLRVMLPGPTAPPRRVIDSARHPAWALLPAVALLVIIWALTTFGHWGNTRAAALTIGMSTGMLATNGLALAMGRRASLSLSLGKLAAARRFFFGCLALGVGFTAVLATVATVVPWHAIAFLAQDREVFIAASVSLAAIWLTASALSLVAAVGWTGLSLAGGTTVGIGLDRALTAVTSYHLAVGVVTGTAVVLTAMLAALQREAKARAGDPGPGHHRLPSVGYLTLEAGPYFLYGTLGVVMFVAVHVLGWSVLHGNRALVATLELGLFLPLLPAVLATGRAERSLRAFWDRAGELQRQTTAADRHLFGEGLLERYRHDARQFLLRLLLSSAITAAGVEVLLATGSLHHVVAYPDPAAVRLLFFSGLVAYGLVAVAQFNCMFAMSFVRYVGPLRALAVGITVTLAAGVALTSRYGYSSLGIALAFGGLAYTAVSVRLVRPLLVSADHHFFCVV